jgi:hypothetical protein
MCDARIVHAANSSANKIERVSWLPRKTTQSDRLRFLDLCLRQFIWWIVYGQQIGVDQ